MKSSSDRSWIALRLRALVGLVVVAVLLPAIGGWFGLVQARRALTHQVERDQLTTARSLASEVEQSFRFSISFAKAAAQRPGLTDAVAKHDAPRAKAVLQNIVDTTPLLRTVAVYIAPKKPLIRYPLPLTSPEASLTSSSTSRVFDARPFRDDAILTVREPFVLRGKTVGFLLADISFQKAAPAATVLRFGETGTATIVDRDAHVLTSGEPRRIGATLNAPELAKVIERFRPGALHYFSSLLKRREIAGFAPVTGYPWGVLVTESEAEALAPIAHSLRMLILGLAVLILLGLAITLLVLQAFDRYDRRLGERLVEQERLNRALEGFSRHVAHDLRTPIAVIQLAAQTIERETLVMSETGQKAAGMIGRQANRASELVEDLLDLARASGTPHIELFDLEEIVKEAARDVEALDLKIERPLPTIGADRATIRQAIANLFVNASRYARSNGVAAVNVWCATEESAWVLAVADRGPGLPEGGAQKMFEPFTRGAARQTEHGSGLGLAIVAAAAQAHGGGAWYEPRQGGGSVFHIRIPRSFASSSDRPQTDS